MANSEQRLKHPERASLLAREAAVDAAYAKALAERIVAERQRAIAAALLRDSLPPVSIPAPRREQ
jgi:hypothetical protein